MVRQLLVLLAACGLLSAIAAPATAQTVRQPLALFKLEAVGASEIEAAAATDRLHEELLATGRFSVVDRDALDAAVKEQARKPEGCAGNACAVKLGKQLGARKAVLGKVTRLGETQWQVSANLVDVGSGDTEQVSSIQFEGAYIILLRDRIANLAAKLAALPVGEVPGVSAKAQASAPPTPATPGAISPAPSPSRGGFSIYYGRSLNVGTLRLRTGDSLKYSSNPYRFGLDWQWQSLGPFAFAAFFEFGGADPSGPLAANYDSVSTGGFGVEIRLLSRALYLSGTLGSYSTVFYNMNTMSMATDLQDLRLSGFGAGLGIGLAGERWYLHAGVKGISMKATPPLDPTLPQGKSATEARADVTIGYRWKRP